MPLTATKRHDFVSVASVSVLVFIGVVFLIGLIGRCLALNQSPVRNTQCSDLMIYKVPPRTNPSQQKSRPSTDILVISTSIQRGPKNL